MAILRNFRKFATEALGESVFLRFFSWLFNFFKDKVVPHPVVQDFVKATLEKRLKFNGLEDESVFAWIFSKADFGKIEKKVTFQKACNELEKEDKINGTRNMKNFRVIIALDALGHGIIKSYDKEGNIIKSEFDPKYKQPGITILEGLAVICETKKDWRASIMMVGAMQEAPFGALNEFEIWAKNKAWPMLKNVVSVFIPKVSEFFVDVEAYAVGFNILSKRKVEEYEELPLWKKYLLNK